MSFEPEHLPPEPAPEPAPSTLIPLLAALVLLPTIGVVTLIYGWLALAWIATLGGGATAILTYVYLLAIGAVTYRTRWRFVQATCEPPYWAWPTIAIGILLCVCGLCALYALGVDLSELFPRRRRRYQY